MLSAATIESSSPQLPPCSSSAATIDVRVPRRRASSTTSPAAKKPTCRPSRRRTARGPPLFPGSSMDCAPSILSRTLVMSRGTCCRNDRNTRRRPSGEMTTLELPTCDDRIVTASPRSISTRLAAGGSGIRSATAPTPSPPQRRWLRRRSASISGTGYHPRRSGTPFRRSERRSPWGQRIRTGSLAPSVA